MSEQQEKIFFELKVVDGYPPYSIESLWCDVIHDQRNYKISNIPFFIKGIAINDVISVALKDDKLYFKKIIKPSTNSTLRIVSVNQTEDELLSLLNELEGLGCNYEEFNGLYAVNIPESIDIHGLLSYLDDGKNAGSIDVEYAVIRGN